MQSSIEKLCPITITSSAGAEIRTIMKIKGIPEDYHLRVGTSGGGCAGVTYILGFDRKSESDVLYYVNDIKIIIDKKHALFLWGVEVDYVQSEESGFVFNSDTFSKLT